MGMPCSHRLVTYLRNDVPIPVSDFVPHWHLSTTAALEENSQVIIVLDRPQPRDREGFNEDEEEDEEPLVELENIRDPPPQSPRKQGRFENVQRAVDRGNRRARVPQSQNSSIKVPSLFELVEGVPARFRRCGECKRTGHNRRTCPRVRNGGLVTQMEVDKEEEEEVGAFLEL
jgi:hypothetical protein